MDAIIDFKEVADFLKNPPSLEPRPDFAKIRALRKHIVTALAGSSVNSLQIAIASIISSDTIPFALEVATELHIGSTKSFSFNQHPNCVGA